MWFRLLDPFLWGVAAMALVIGSAFGAWSGWHLSNASAWRERAREYETTIERLHKSIDRDRSQQSEDDRLIADLQKRLEGLNHDEKSACTLSGGQLERLRKL